MAGETNIGANPTTAANVDFGAIMNQGLNRLSQNQERARLEKEAEAQRLKEFEEQYGIDEDLFLLDDTEFRTVNDTATEAVSMYRDRYYDVYKELKNNPSDIDLKKRMGNIKNSVKRLSASTTKMKEIGDKYLEMIENDQLSGVDEDRWRERLEATDDGRIKISLDGEDNMQFLFYDKSGKLNGVVPFKEFIKDDLIQRVDVNSEIDSLVESIGGLKKDEITGGYIRTSDVFGAKQEAFVDDFINSYLGTDAKSLEENAVLADLLNQATGGSSKKRNNFTESERQFVKDYLKRQVRSRYDEEVSLKKIPTSSTGRPTATELKQPTLDKLNPATGSDDSLLVKDGKAVLTYAGGLKLEESGSNLSIDDIRVTPDGQFELRGTDKIKKKGKQGETKEDIFAKEKSNGIEPSMIEILMNNDGTYTYNVTTRIEPITGEEAANKLGNILKVSDKAGLKKAIRDKIYSRFGKEAADAFYNNQSPKVEIPTEVKANSGSTYK